MGNEVIPDKWRDEDHWPNEAAVSAQLAHDHHRQVAMRRLKVTAHEIAVLTLIADEGLTNAQIAKRLFLGEETIKSRVKALLRKTSSRSRAHLVAESFRAGLLH